MLTIPNYIDGCVKNSQSPFTLYSCEGLPYAEAYFATPAQLRKFKRAIPSIKKRLNTIPVDTLIHLLQQAFQNFINDETAEHTAKLSGVPSVIIKQDWNTLRLWFEALPDYLQDNFGSENYQRSPVIHPLSHKDFRRFQAKGPLISILPSNSEIESLVLIAIALLSRTPALLRSSRRGTSNYIPTTFLQCFNKVVDQHTFSSDIAEALMSAVCVANLQQDSVADVIEQLDVIDGVYYLFGSDKTLQDFKHAIPKNRTIVEFGTGYGVSYLSSSAELDSSLNNILESVSYRNGTQCTNTKLLYVHQDIYPQVIDELFTRSLAKKYQPSDVLGGESTIGLLPPESQKSVKSHAANLVHSEQLHINNKSTGLSFIELQPEEVFPEYPAPICGVRKVKDHQDFLESMKNDLERMCMSRNLVSSIYSSDNVEIQSLINSIPSHSIRVNLPTTRFALHIEHQGKSLISSLMQVQTVEGWESMELSD
ncbi:aldehyde dehydrogenase family protein [Paraneptunicella aestuarii]|uniref:aldehyde dehydrogenase family protein n=1 Tax=Paraneptunicella aestuarii TaxID=2831148 RepID=UPI001E43F03B|nr:aldehyde dehydrogenase family protein [Paraneptunicella aestuarii]UAA37710.1 aldehyde dehydrogenase family protein [Paraneptunicella aestuarii]